jgi:mitochondrial fission protein ELM1
MIEILVYLNDTNMGDDNNARGVGNELAALYRSQNEVVEYKETHLLTIEEIEKALSKNGKIIITAAGNHTLKPLATIKEKFMDKVFIAWGAHQIHNDTLKIASQFDLVHFPRGICGFAAKQTLGNKLVEIAGVPHNLTQKTIDEAYDKFKDRIPSSSEKQLLVILSGDAP